MTALLRRIISSFKSQVSLVNRSKFTDVQLTPNWLRPTGADPNQGSTSNPGPDEVRKESWEPGRTLEIGDEKYHSYLYILIIYPCLLRRV